MTKYQLRKAMHNCNQTNTQTIMQHGFSVARYFKDLYQHIFNNTPLQYQWKLPSWIYDKQLWGKIVSYDTMINYLIYHDCGKPFCIEIDKEGKRHFPNHAEISAQLWQDAGGSEDEYNLMLHDMCLHTSKPHNADFIKQNKYCYSLLISALCEIHSNCAMFGGLDSTSFKIKWKNLNKIALKIIN